MGDRLTVPIIPIVYGFVAYWWTLHEQAQATGYPNYLLAILAFGLWIIIANLSNALKLSFVLAYLLPILAFALFLLSALFLPLLILVFLFAIPVKGVVRLAIAGTFVLVFVVFDGSSLFLLVLFPLSALIGAELGMQDRVKKAVEPLLNAVASVIGGITGIFLLTQVSQAFFGEGNSITGENLLLVLGISAAVMMIAIIFIYRNVNRSLKVYRETDDTISALRRYRWLRYVAYACSVFIGLYSLYALYQVVLNLGDGSASINLAEVRWEHLNPFVLRLPEEFEGVITRYSSYFETPEDISQVASFRIQTFKVDQPVYACPAESCDLLLTLPPDRAFFVLNTVSCREASPPSCGASGRSDWLEVAVDYRIGWVRLR